MRRNWSRIFVALVVATDSEEMNFWRRVSIVLKRKYEVWAIFAFFSKLSARSMIR